MFSLKIYHGGEFSKFPGRQYVNGRHSYIDFLDADEFSVHELDSMMLQLGYDGNRKMYYHFKKPDSDLDVGLMALGSDGDVCKLTSYVPKHRLLEVYIELDKTTVCTYFQSPGGSNVIIQEIEDDGTPDYTRVRSRGSSSTKSSCGKRLELDWFPNHDFNIGNDFDKTISSEHALPTNVDHSMSQGIDSIHEEPDGEDGFDISEDEDNGSEDDDFYVDEEDVLHDVEVDMNDFYVNTNKDLEWIEPKSNLKDVTDEDNENIEILDNEDFDSISEGEEGIDRIRKSKLRALRKKNKEIEAIGSKGTHFSVGQAFYTSKEVKKAINNYAVERRREISLDKNDKNRVKAVCNGTIPNLSFSTSSDPSKGTTVKGKGVKSMSRSCPWVLYVSKWREEDDWVVKTFNDNHTCLQSRKIKACTATYLSNKIVNQIESNPTIPLKALQEDLERKYEIGVSRMKVFRAKTKAYNQVMGDYKIQYELLRDYVLELQSMNEDTTVKIDVEEEPNLSNMETRVFRRIYVCIGSLKKGFKAGKRDLLGLDGCFMKGPYPGQILTAVVLIIAFNFIVLHLYLFSPIFLKFGFIVTIFFL